MKKIIFFIAFLTVFQTIYSQEKSIKKDTLETHNFLKEVIIISNKRKDLDNKKYIKPL